MTRVASNEGPWLDVFCSRDFPGWLEQNRIGLAFTTYQTGKLFLLGLGPTGRLSAFERTFNRCMGLWSNGQTLWMSSLYQLWRFENALLPGQLHDGFDRLYIPRVGYTTGDLDVHDVAIDGQGRPIFVNTRFNCLATVSDHASFKPVWKPPFISRLAPEDRCHLNGLAMVDGRAKYVSYVAATDVIDGWRDHRRNGGCVMDVATGDVVISGLSMPHSPRVHNGRLWALDSGRGYLGYVDLARAAFEQVTFCPGYLRGLAFHGEHAVVGLSRAREERTFADLPLADELAQRNAEPRCGINVIHLGSGDTAHWVRIEGLVSELYDVVILPDTVRPMSLGFKSDEIQRLLRFEEAVLGGEVPREPGAEIPVKEAGR